MTVGRRRAVAAVFLAAAAAITLGPEATSLLELTHRAAVEAASIVPGVDSRPRRSEVEGALNVIVPAAMLVLLAWSFPTAPRRRVALVTASAWWAVEVVQLAVPGRHPRLRDLVLNTVGVALGLAALTWYERWRRERTLVRPSAAP